MLRLVGEGYDFGFYAGTITRSDALDLSVEKGRVGQTFAQYLVHLFVGKAGPALQLFQLARFAHERKAVEVVFSVLCFHQLIVYAASVYADRRTGLHTSGGDSVAGD